MTPQEFLKHDRDEFVDDLIALIQKYDGTPMNGDFVDSLAKLPDETLLHLYEDYRRKLSNFQERQKSASDMSHLRLG